MQKRIILEKPVGATPLMTVEAWRALHPEFEGVPLSYAGRLDPMAEGKLLVLIGDECKRQGRYANLDKEYEIEVLFGFGSDTGDVLGLPESAHAMNAPEGRLLARAIQNQHGAKTLPYPAFSSKTVGGKPLFLHALEGTIGSIEIPTHTERIYRIEMLGEDTIHSADLLKRILAKIALVSYDADPRKTLGADFRRADIRTGWEKHLSTDAAYRVIRLRVTAGSGTYMRSLAGRLGEALGTRALAYSIKRTKIGRYQTVGPFGFWLWSY